MQDVLETMQSVKAQNHYDVQHIIKDGISTDNTISIIKEQEQDNL